MDKPRYRNHWLHRVVINTWVYIHGYFYAAPIWQLGLRVCIAVLYVREWLVRDGLLAWCVGSRGLLFDDGMGEFRDDTDCVSAVYVCDEDVEEQCGVAVLD